MNSKPRAGSGMVTPRSPLAPIRRPKQKRLKCQVEADTGLNGCFVNQTPLRRMLVAKTAGTLPRSAPELERFFRRDQPLGGTSIAGRLQSLFRPVRGPGS